MIDPDEAKKKAEQKIDDTIDKATDTFMGRLQKAFEDWLEENCGGCI